MTARLTGSPWLLLRQAAGSPSDLASKLASLVRALSAYGDAAALDARLSRLNRLGYIDRIPSRLQLVVGSIDMLRFWISPAAADYYASKGINYSFHQLLRVLDDPTSMINPTGFLSTRETIIGHLMQVTHANPRYDLQLLETYEGGLEELQHQVEQMIAGTHPRCASIGAIVEDPDYHQRLLQYVVAYRKHPDTDAPIRENVSASPYWARVERTFGSLPNAMRYFAHMPNSLTSAAHHLYTVCELPEYS